MGEVKQTASPTLATEQPVKAEPMTNPKRHLLVTSRRAACGVKDPRRSTRSPAQVTCGGCIKTLAMADAEVTNRERTRRKAEG